MILTFPLLESFFSFLLPILILGVHFTDQASTSQTRNSCFPTNSHTLRLKCRCCNLIPENRRNDRERERRQGSPWIKAENPERSRASECHILVVRSRRKEEARGEAPGVEGEEEEKEREEGRE